MQRFKSILFVGSHEAGANLLIDVRTVLVPGATTQDVPGRGSLPERVG